MKKNFFTMMMAAGLLLAACNDESDNKLETAEKGKVSFNVTFASTDAPVTRAHSTAIPVTSWANISQVQFFLCSGPTVVYSQVETPSSTQKTFHYTDVPVGTYTVVAVANARSSVNPITSFINGSASEWTPWNVRQKPIDRLSLRHNASAFPSFASAAPPAAAFAAPAEVFTAYGTVTVASNAPATVSLQLRREVALMRIRIDADPKDSNGNQSGTNADIDFTKDASISIFRVPDSLKIAEGNAGGVSPTSTETNAVVLTATGALFETANPTSGYSTPATILTDNFTLWKDIIVMPNNGGRAAPTTGNADDAHKYFLVISAWAKPGHVFADGSTTTAGATVFWQGVVNEKFIPNNIREVNLSLRTGGTTTMPSKPTLYGNMDITVLDPEPWDSNIAISEVSM